MNEEAVRAALAEAKEEIHGQHMLINKQAYLLTRAVKIARGEPPELVWWSHHDLPEWVEYLHRKNVVLIEMLRAAGVQPELIERVLADVPTPDQLQAQKDQADA